MSNTVSAPPDFVFDGDTFAVPSWEFRCTLPPVMCGDGLPPHTNTYLFGLTWEIFRSYGLWGVTRGVVFVAPSGHGFVVLKSGEGTHVLPDNEKAAAIPWIEPKRAMTPDEFMAALKAIAERNAE